MVVSLPPRLFAAAALLGAAATLAGCGQSDAAKREQVVRCTGFSIALTRGDDASGTDTRGTDAHGTDTHGTDTGTTRADAEALLNKDGITGSDTVPMGAAAAQYAKTMDPARVSHLSQDGAGAAAELLGKKDAPGIANYVKACVGTFKSLGQ